MGCCRTRTASHRSAPNRCKACAASTSTSTPTISIENATIVSRMRVWPIGLVASLAAGLIAGVAAAPQLADVSADLGREPALQYFTKPTTDAIGKLNADLQRGAVRLTFDDTRGYLPSVLEALQVSSKSQILIFSKTSVQSRFINPRNPRAIYFNEV